MDELVKKLSNGVHPIKFESRTEEIQEIKDRLDDGFVFATFTKTRGGTELGINVEKDLTDISKADFEKGKGHLHISGTCELNYHKIRCVADVDFTSREGTGYLIPLDETDKVH